MPAKPYPPETRNEVARLLNAGWTHALIASELNVSRTFICKVVEETGIRSQYAHGKSNSEEAKDRALARALKKPTRVAYPTKNFQKSRRRGLRVMNSQNPATKK